MNIDQIVNKLGNNFVVNLTGLQIVLSYLKLFSADGPAKEELTSLVGDIQEEELYSLIESLNDESTICANSLWHASDIATSDKFKYLDLGELSVEKMNDWVKEKTKGKIKDAIDAIDPDTAFVLMNCSYFKDKWKKEFNKTKTKDGEFNGKICRKMSLKDNFKYYSDKTVSSIIVPYSSGYNLRIFLPEDDKVEISKFLLIKHTSYRNETCELRLPILKNSTSLKFKDILKSLNISNLFSNCDFSNLTSCECDVSEILQDVNIEWDETGTEAAALTQAVVLKRCVSHDTIFDVNKTFWFSIENKKNDVVYLGKISKVNNED